MRRILLLLLVFAFLLSSAAAQDVFSVKNVRTFKGYTTISQGVTATVFQTTETMEINVTIHNETSSSQSDTVTLNLIEQSTGTVMETASQSFTAGARSDEVVSFTFTDLDHPPGTYLVQATVPRQGNEYEGNNKGEAIITLLGPERTIAVDSVPLFLVPLIAFGVLALVFRKVKQ